jgi:mycofactocin precursor
VANEPTALVEPVEETETPELVEDVLVEEVSIDGMCGVY